jgi:hypothetical protein
MEAGVTTDMIGLGIMALGLAVSASCFRSAILATRGEGPSRLRPLTLAYWTGLALILAGVAVQIWPESR